MTATETKQQENNSSGIFPALFFVSVPDYYLQLARYNNKHLLQPFNSYVRLIIHSLTLLIWNKAILRNIGTFLLYFCVRNVFQEVLCSQEVYFLQCILCSSFKEIRKRLMQRRVPQRMIQMKTRVQVLGTQQMSWIWYCTYYYWSFGLEKFVDKLFSVAFIGHMEHLLVLLYQKLFFCLWVSSSFFIHYADSINSPPVSIWQNRGYTKSV